MDFFTRGSSSSLEEPASASDFLRFFGVFLAAGFLAEALPGVFSLGVFFVGVFFGVFFFLGY